MIENGRYFWCDKLGIVGKEAFFLPPPLLGKLWNEGLNNKHWLELLAVLPCFNFQNESVVCILSRVFSFLSAFLLWVSITPTPRKVLGGDLLTHDVTAAGWDRTSGCWTCAPRTIICEVWGFLLLHSLWSPMLWVSVCRGWDPDFYQGWKCMSVCIWDRILHFYSQWSLLGKMLLHSITTQTKDLSNLYSSAWYLLKAVLMVSLKNNIQVSELIVWCFRYFFFKQYCKVPQFYCKAHTFTHFPISHKAARPGIIGAYYVFCSSIRAAFTAGNGF